MAKLELLSDVQVQCPYCWEAIEVVIDSSGGDQTYYEDCEVCCQPIEVRLWTDGEGGLLSVEVHRDNE